MAVTLVVAGTSYTYPGVGDTVWGAQATAWAQAVSTSMLQTSGGTFALTADANFGSSFGLLAKYFTSISSSPAQSGVLRLANADGIGFRNVGNTADILLKPDADGILQYNSIDLVNLSSAQSLTNKTFDSTSTLTGAKIASFTPDGSHTLTAPTFTDTLAVLASAQTFTNKTIAAGSNTISGLANVNLSGSAGITNANLAAMNANTVKANTTSGSATPTDVSTGTVTEATSAVLTLSGWTNATLGSPTIQVKQASASQSGYLSSADWTTFNSNVFHYLATSNTSVYGGTNSTLSLSGADNTVVGSGAGAAITSGTDNTLFGYFAGNAVTGSKNTIIGSQSAATTQITTGTRNTMLGFDCSPGLVAATDAVLIGYDVNQGTTFGGYGDVVIGSSAVGNGANATSLGSSVVVIGYGAGNGGAGNGSVSIGNFAVAGNTGSIVLGTAMQTNSTNCFVVGHTSGVTVQGQQYIATTGAGQITFGGPSNVMKDVFLGQGAVGVVTPSNVSIQPTPVGAGNSNTTGGNFTLSAGNGTGTGGSGSIIFQTAPAGTTGSAVNTLATVFAIMNTGAVNHYGSSSGIISVATQAAAGTYNFNLPTTAGTAGTVLTSQGGGSTAMTWTAVLTSPMTTLGDSLIGGVSGAPARLAVGQNGQVLTGNSTATNGQSWGNPANYRNHLVNSGFDWWQAGTSVAVTATGAGTPTATYAYQADQWYCNNILGGGTIEGIVTYSQQAFSNYGSGFAAQLKITTAPTGTGIQNGCELYQTLSNKATKAFLASQQASFNILVKALGNVNQVGVQLYYNSSEAKVNTSIGSEVVTTVNSSGFLNCTINGQSLSGVVASLATGSLGVRIRPTAVSTGNLYDLNNGFQVEQAMLNVGPVAMPYSRQYEDPAAEFVSCQYFYEKSYDPTVTPGTITDAGEDRIVAGGGTMQMTSVFQVAKRITNSSITFYSPGTGTSGKIRNATGSADVATLLQFQGCRSVTQAFTATDTNVYASQWVCDARI